MQNEDIHVVEALKNTKTMCEQSIDTQEREAGATKHQKRVPSVTDNDVRATYVHTCHQRECARRKWVENSHLQNGGTEE